MFSEKLCQNWLGRVGIETDYKKTVSRGKIGRLKEDLASVRRPVRGVTEIRDAPLTSHGAKRGDYEQPALAFFRAIYDRISVGRPIGLPILSGSVGYLERVTAAYLLHPNIELPTAI